MNESPLYNIAIVAAEASSELYATRILEEARRRNLPFRFFGIGSHRMEELGCELVEKSENMAVVGLLEVMAHWKVIHRAFNKLVGRAKKTKISLALLLDYPDFNLRLARRLNRLSVPVVYFISPQVWAWRQSRVHLIKRIVSKMLVVFPFEKDFYNKFGVPVEFVGHPLLDELDQEKLTIDERKQLRAQLGFSEDDFVVGLLPGSRDSELKYNLETQMRAAQIVGSRAQNARFALLVAPTLQVDHIKSLLPEGIQIPLRIVKENPFRILQIFDAALVASGTATLMTGLAEVPMVIMYKMNKVTGFLARYLVKGPQHFGMANLILGERAVPEFFQEEASEQVLAEEILKYIGNKELRGQVRSKLALIRTRLGNGGATDRVVDVLQSMVEKKSS